MINNANAPIQPMQMKNYSIDSASSIVGFDINKYLDGKNDSFQSSPNCTQINENPQQKSKKISGNVASIIGASLLSCVATASAMLLFFKKH